MDWISHCYQAPVQFEQNGNTLIIVNVARDSRGSWRAWDEGAGSPGRLYQLRGTLGGGHVRSRFFRAQTDFMHGYLLEPGETFQVPEGATMIRVDCRLWGQAGTAVFQNIKIIKHQNSEPTQAHPHLPIPEPNRIQKHHILEVIKNVLPHQ